MKLCLNIHRIFHDEKIRWVNISPTAGGTNFRDCDLKRRRLLRSGEFMTKRKEAGCRVHSVRGRKRKEGGRRHRPYHVVNDLFGRTRTRIVVRGGMRGIARVHLPESYFPPVHYRTVRAARYVHATARQSIRNCSRARVPSV